MSGLDTEGTNPKGPAGPPAYEDLKTLGMKEWIAALALLNLLFWLAWLLPQGVGQPPAAPPSPDRVIPAPWVFLAVQWLLLSIPPFWGGVVLPLASLALLLAIPYLPGKPGLRRTLFLLLTALWLLASLGAYLRFYHPAG